MKKKYVLKKWVKDVLKTLGIIALIIAMCLLLKTTSKNNDEAIDYCMNQGGTLEQCRKGVLGIYGE